MSVRDDLNNLSKLDIYSIVLFTMYKLRDTNEYSSLSELCYVLDEKNLLNLCEYFGGTTITIPTIQELKNLIYSFVLYEYVNIKGIEYNDAVTLLGYDSTQLRKVKSNYVALCKVLDNYNFNTGNCDVK